MTGDTPDFRIPDTAVSVAGLTDYIQTLLEQDDQLRQIWVIGEVSSASQYPSGLFFTLQDPAAKALINCVAWKGQIKRLETLPVVGEQLVVLGNIRVYPQQGKYQLMVLQALPAGEGLRSLRYRQLCNRLEAEGLFDPAQKRPLPSHPQTIAVVSSPQAAAWGDIHQSLRDRYPGLHVLFSAAQVQGAQAPESIVAAIKRVLQDGRAEVLIVSRGGGAVEDLDCFNDERVVRAIASCPIPVITGIGHQRDESLADWVADVCVRTPTAVAERVVPSLATLYTEHRQRVAALNAAVYQQLQKAEDKMQRLGERLQRLRLDGKIEQEREAIARTRQRLGQVTKQRFQQASQYCDLLEQKLATLDPKAVLKRGYALVRQENGKIVRSTDGLVLGQELLVQLEQGEVKVKVAEILD